jgi:hypothetical protein
MLGHSSAFRKGALALALLLGTVALTWGSGPGSAQAADNRAAPKKSNGQANRLIAKKKAQKKHAKKHHKKHHHKKHHKKHHKSQSLRKLEMELLQALRRDLGRKR